MSKHPNYVDVDARAIDAHNIDSLLAVVARLRDPDQGCPWDLKQTFRTILPYTLEEAYEVAEAIEADDMVELCEELGDLLFQVAIYARMAEEKGDFDFGDVVASISTKMIRRHPHVFGDAEVASEAEVRENWETHEGRRAGGQGQAAAHQRARGRRPGTTRFGARREVAEARGSGRFRLGRFGRRGRQGARGTGRVRGDLFRACRPNRTGARGRRLAVLVRQSRQASRGRCRAGAAQRKSSLRAALSAG